MKVNWVGYMHISWEASRPDGKKIVVKSKDLKEIFHMLLHYSLPETPTSEKLVNYLISMFPDTRITDLKHRAGKHICSFYKTEEELANILVSYFAEGLSNNESCVWVTTPPLDAEGAKVALHKTIPDLEKYIRDEQIAILPYSSFYPHNGEFKAHNTLDAWLEKKQDALNHGFAGLRLTGNTSWLERNLWKYSVDYKVNLHNLTREHQITAVCTYSLETCNGKDVIDIIRNHDNILIADETFDIRKKANETSIKYLV